MVVQETAPHPHSSEVLEKKMIYQRQGMPTEHGLEEMKATLLNADIHKGNFQQLLIS